MGEEDFDTGLRPDEVGGEPRTPIETPWGVLALYDTGGELVAANAWCPHLSGPLLQGSVREGCVTCPWHSWVFSLETGECTWTPDGVARPQTRIRVHATRLGPSGTLLVLPPEGEGR